MKKLNIIGRKTKKSLSPIIYYFLLSKSKTEYKKISSKKKNKYTNIIMVLKESKYTNITIPYKEEAIKICNYISENSNNSKSANTIIRKKESIKGFNTDGIGFKKTIIKKIKLKNNNKVSVYIYGAGGAAKGIINTIKKIRKIKKIRIINRNEKKIEGVIKQFKDKKIKKYNNNNKNNNNNNKERERKIIINTIPHKAFKKAIKKHNNKKTFIYDINYNNKQTNNKKKINGLNMLMQQGLENIKIINEQ